jgi:hypothetical protein
MQWIAQKAADAETAAAERHLWAAAYKFCANVGLKNQDVPGRRLAFDLPRTLSSGSAMNCFCVQLLHSALTANGMSRFVFVNAPTGAGSSSQSDEADIRRAIIEAELVDCMIASSSKARRFPSAAGSSRNKMTQAIASLAYNNRQMP